jgi:hypothetical protein
VIRRLRAFATRHAGLGPYLQAPGDGRVAPVVPASAILWAVLVAYVLRDGAFHAVEALVRSPARRVLGIRRPFSDDTVAYFTERLDAGRTRRALVTLVRQAKRRKGFDDVVRIGLVLDGTTAGRCPTGRCPWCHPVVVPHMTAAGARGPIGTVVGQQHKLARLSVVGGALLLPVDVEPYGPGDSEHAASLRLLDRGVRALGRRFAQYVVADSLYASAPFLRAVGARGLHALVRLKANVPTLYAAAQARFAATPAHGTFERDGDRVEVWDADDFDPWDGLPWPTVRVLRYRQTHPDGTVVEASWLTDFATRCVSSRTLYQWAKGRWTIENQGFNDAKSRYGLAHVPHHHANSLLLHWLLVLLTLTLERLFRVRYLHRGAHPPLSAMQVLRRFRLALGAPLPDSS